MMMPISLRSYLVAGISASVLSGTMLIAPAVGQLAQPSQLAVPSVSEELALAGVELPYPYPKEIAGLVDVLAYNLEANGTDPSSFTNFGDFFLRSLGGSNLSDFIGDVPFALYETNDELFTELDDAGLGVMATVVKKLYSGELPGLDETLLGVASLGVYSSPGPEGVALAAFMDAVILAATVPLGIINQIGLAAQGLGGAEYLFETLPATLNTLGEQAYAVSRAFTEAVNGGNFSAVAQSFEPLVATIRQLSAEITYFSAHLSVRTALPEFAASPLLDAVDQPLRSAVKLLSGADIRPAQSAVVQVDPAAAVDVAPAAEVPATQNDSDTSAVAPMNSESPAAQPDPTEVSAVEVPSVDVIDTVRGVMPSFRSGASPADGVEPVLPDIDLPDIDLPDIDLPVSAPDVPARPSLGLPETAASAIDTVKDVASSITGAGTSDESDTKSRGGVRGSRSAE
jgi:hypothetical protein